LRLDVSEGKQIKTYKPEGQISNNKSVPTYLFKTKVRAPKLEFKRQFEDNRLIRLS